MIPLASIFRAGLMGPGHAKQLAAAVAGVFPEAPSDSKTYGRKNAAWVDVTAELLTGKYLPLTGGTVTGATTFDVSPIVPTPTAGDSTTKAASTAFVAAAVAAVPTGIADAPNNANTYGRKGGAWVDITATLLANYLPLAGGNLSGNLQIIKNTPNLVLQMTAGTGQSAGILGRVNAAARWWLFLGDTAAESTGNAGSNFALNSYDDAGALIGTPLKIDRATSLTTLGASLTMPGGNITIGARAYPSIQLTATPGTASQYLGAKSPGGVRWNMEMGNAVAESGGNVGSDWNLSRWTDAGAWIDAVLNISRSAAAVTGSAIATAAQYIANTAGKLLTTDALWASAGATSIAYAASITPNFSVSINMVISPITGALTLNNPTGQKAGQSGFIRLSSSGGGFALTFGTAYYFPTGTKPTTMGQFNDMLYYQCIDGSSIFCSYVKSYTNA